MYVAAKSIGYSGGTSGAYVTELFQRMGIADELKPKLRQAPPGVPVGDLIARGEVEMGLHQRSELLPVKPRRADDFEGRIGTSADRNIRGF